MRDLTNTMNNLDKHKKATQRRVTVYFEDFLQAVIKHPERYIRDIYHVYSDLIHAHVCEGVDEYIEDPHSIGYLNYECQGLFADNVDRPFFADRLFANRFMRHVESLLIGAQQNKIFIFDGPHGSGKSTFLNNLLKKFEIYTNSPEGTRYEVVWRLPDNKKFLAGHDFSSLSTKLAWVLKEQTDGDTAHQFPATQSDDEHDTFLDIPCPSHDNPLLLIPKDVRRQFFDDLFENDKYKWKLFTEKRFEWLFRDEPCTVCMSIYYELLEKYKDPKKVMDFVFARPYLINRRVGQGITVFNPGDKPQRNEILSNKRIQNHLNSSFPSSRSVQYLYSQYASTNNGIYSLMDIKSHNSNRLMDLHNIISEGVHKVENIEEKVNSLFFAIMNPEDKKMLTDLQALSDRIEYINIPYVLDLQTEVEIYRGIFGKHIAESFLPRVLHNFARVIISTRLRTKSEAMLDWIPQPEKYDLYCDKHLQLLKMEIFTGYIPKWLQEEDIDKLTAKKRQKIISESEKDGWKGLSGRDSIKLFNDFYSTYSTNEKMIDMSTLVAFFKKFCKEDRDIIPMGFLDSLLKMYNYTVLQEVKESLYYYNEEQISKDIMNYMFAVNFELGSTETCSYTGETLTINDSFFERIETRLQVEPEEAVVFRNNVQKSYTTGTLTQEILRDELDIEETSLYTHLYEKYLYHLKEKVMEPFLKNDNFRRAVKDYNREGFKTYDKRVQDDVNYMMNNLQKKYSYSSRGAKEICMYVIDNKLAEQLDT